MNNFKNIVAGVDGSDGSIRGIDLSSRHAQCVAVIVAPDPA